MTGWKWEDVEAMRLPNLSALTKWWGQHPPMAYAGSADEKKSEHPGVAPGDDEVLTDDGLVGLLTGRQ